MIRIAIYTLALLNIELLAWEYLRDELPFGRQYKVGDLVFYKDDAIARRGDKIIDKYEVLYWPCLVEKIEGNRVWVGAAYFHRNDLMNVDEALDFCSREIERNPTTWMAWRKRGSCWSSKGEPGKALKDFDQAILINPQGAVTYSDRGQLKAKLSDLDGAIKDLDEAIRLSPPRAFLYLNRGEVKFQAGKYVSAIQDFNKSLQLEPENPVAYYIRGITRHSLRYLPAAMKDYDETIRLNPNHKSAYYHRGIIKSEFGDLDGAVNDLSDNLRLAPDEVRALIERGNAHHRKGNYKEAIDDYTKASELDEKSFTAKSKLAFLFATCPDASLRDGVKATVLSEKALTLKPQNPYALNSKACALAAMNKFDEAIKTQRDALEYQYYANDNGFDGGLESWKRIAEWNSGKLWLTSPQRSRAVNATN